jgi:hypothetical protein
MKQSLACRLGSALLLALVLISPLLLTGCSSPDTENQAYRPWGGAQGWQGGLPSSLTEGR